MGDAVNGDDSFDLGQLDYWTFINLASKRLGEEVEGFESIASRMVISLNRAATLVIYDLESSVHRPRGMSWPSFRVLFVLWLAGPIEPGRAAKLIGMSRAAVSNLSATLIAKGMVNKRPSATDGRMILLQVTDEGANYARTAFLDQNLRETRWASALTDAEQQVLVMLLEKLMSHRGEIGARIRE